MVVGRSMGPWQIFWVIGAPVKEDQHLSGLHLTNYVAGHDRPHQIIAAADRTNTSVKIRPKHILRQK
jgi:hypothetical protein